MVLKLSAPSMKLVATVREVTSQAASDWLNAAHPLNTSVMFVIADVSNLFSGELNTVQPSKADASKVSTPVVHCPRKPSNELHPLNVLPMTVTELTFQLLTLPFNEVHPLNRSTRLVTALVVIPCRSELKAAQPRNMLDIPVGEAFHELRSDSNTVHPLNILFKLATELTFQLDRLSLNSAQS